MLLVKEMITQVVEYYIINITLIKLNFSKQQALDAYPKEIQKFDFIGNLKQAGNLKIPFSLEDVK